MNRYLPSILSGSHPLTNYVQSGIQENVRHYRTLSLPLIQNYYYILEIICSPEDLLLILTGRGHHNCKYKFSLVHQPSGEDFHWLYNQDILIPLIRYPDFPLPVNSGYCM